MLQQDMAPKLGAQRNLRTRVFSGEMKLIDATYKPEYANPKSVEFQETADALQDIVSVCNITPVSDSNKPSNTCWSSSPSSLGAIKMEIILFF